MTGKPTTRHEILCVLPRVRALEAGEISRREAGCP